MNLNSLDETIQAPEDNDEVAHLFEEYEFYATAAVRHVEDHSESTAIVPFVITWTDGGSMENPAGYNDEFCASADLPAREAIDQCLAFIKDAQSRTLAAGNEFHAAIFAHAYEVADPEDASRNWHILRAVTFLHDLEHGAIFYQRYEPGDDANGMRMIGDVQLGAKLANMLTR